MQSGRAITFAFCNTFALLLLMGSRTIVLLGVLFLVVGIIGFVVTRAPPPLSTRIAEVDYAKNKVTNSSTSFTFVIVVEYWNTRYTSVSTNSVYDCGIDVDLNLTQNDINPGIYTGICSGNVSFDPGTSHTTYSINFLFSKVIDQLPVGLYTFFSTLEPIRYNLKAVLEVLGTEVTISYPSIPDRWGELSFLATPIIWYLPFLVYVPVVIILGIAKRVRST